jgi:hypothetical protein
MEGEGGAGEEKGVEKGESIGPSKNYTGNIPNLTFFS